MPAFSNPAEPLSVLVVDDDPDTADSLAAVLTLSGHRARAVYRGAAALAAASADPPDVVLLDLLMPEIDGFEVAHLMRQRAPEALLIAVSSLPVEAFEERCSAAGIHLRLAKPVDPTELRQLLAGPARG